MGLVDRARSLAVGVEPTPVAGRPPSVDPVHEVRHHDVAVQVRVPVAADGVRELAGHHAAGRDHDVAADSRDPVLLQIGQPPGHRGLVRVDDPARLVRAAQTRTARSPTSGR